MLRWTAKPYLLDIRQDWVILSRNDTAENEVIASQAYTDSSPSIAIQTCIEKLPEGRISIETIVENSYAKFWIVTPPENLAHFSDLRISAAARFEALFGVPSVDWVIEAEWDTKKTFLACALPLDLINDIKQGLSFGGKRLKLIRLFPYFIQQWNEYAIDCLDESSGLAVLTGNKLTVALIRDYAIQAIRTFPFSVNDSEAFYIANKNIQSACLQIGIPSPKTLVLTGQCDVLNEEYLATDICWRRPNSIREERKLSSKLSPKMT